MAQATARAILWPKKSRAPLKVDILCKGVRRIPIPTTVEKAYYSVYSVEITFDLQHHGGDVLNEGWRECEEVGEEGGRSRPFLS
jgi:hypothetical protein